MATVNTEDAMSVSSNNENSADNIEISTADALGDTFYAKAQEYWCGVPATVNGMLGGFAILSKKDIEGSRKVLEEFIGCNGRVKPEVALDCGAGIGRVSKHLLIPLFQKIELVEPVPAFIEKAKHYLKDHRKQIVAYHQLSLHQFIPEQGRYSVIWCQWVLAHLTDKDLIQFLLRCKDGLQPGGIVVAKENVASDLQVRMFHDDDSSQTRSPAIFIDIFKKSGYILLKHIIQTDFPSGMLEVRTFVLAPE